MPKAIWDNLTKPKKKTLRHVNILSPEKKKKKSIVEGLKWGAKEQNDMLSFFPQKTHKKKRGEEDESQLMPHDRPQNWSYF